MRTRGIALSLVLVAGPALCAQAPAGAPSAARRAARPTPTPPPLHWAQPSEEAWLVSLIARDILEMATWAARAAPIGKDGLAVRVVPLNGAEGSYEIAAPIGPEDPPFRHRIVLYDHVWAPTNYEGLARAALERLRLKPSAVPPPGPSSTIADLEPETLERENKRISAWLERDMLSLAAHEQAAFLLGAFALREDAGVFSDTRLALCRLSAHLALARALRARSTSSAEADFARLLQTTLIGRQLEAVGEIARLRRGKTTPGQRAWLVALGLRNTGNWRLVPDPARATPLERVEYVRALKRSQSGLKALEYLSGQRLEPATEWSRIGLGGWYHPQAIGFTVQEGNQFAPDAVALEMREWASVWKLSTGKPLGPEAALPSLNLLGGRCVWHVEGAEVGPRVIDRGLWAAFAQRHVLSALRQTEVYFQRNLGLLDEAAAFREEMTKQFAALTLFRPLQERWQGTRVKPKPGSGPPKFDPEEGRCVLALDLERRSPELLGAAAWSELGTLCWRARMENALVDPKLWFTTRVPMGTLYDFDHRSYMSALEFTPGEIESLAKLAPYDLTLIYWRASRRPLDSKMTRAEFDALYGPVAAWDAKAQRIRDTRVEAGAPDRKAAAQSACAADADQCLRAAAELRDLGAIDEAVAAFERAIEHARNRVIVSNATGWLVQHYFEEGRTERALEVARMSAAVYSGTGLDTLGHLLERMGRHEEAERTYAALAERYPDSAFVLDAFYMRYERRVGDGRFRAAAAAAEKKVFPQGLKRVTLADMSGPVDVTGPAGPARAGLPVMEEPSKEFKDMGLRVGDTVVALDGYRVYTDAQYACIRRLTDEPDTSVIVARNGEYIELKGKTKRQRYGPREATEANPRPRP